MSDPAPDTTDLRAGAPIHDDLLALLPLVGVWRGTGAGVVPSSGEQFTYGQLVTFAHDGRPFLGYESRSWLTTPDGDVIRQAWRETGFWRPGRDEDAIEAVLASNTGQALVFAGTAGDQQWDLATTVAAHTSTADDVDAERRFYAVRGDELLYATELATPGAALAAHLNGRLVRQPAAQA
ncbi:FABP family protein [uncultured Jatrophihabitans sp.]|uniref:FABP family protein n=1 Tax=uncultured Jatrophihabitans sp. TaxID=1610747 RepID=UPI0035CC3B71